MTSPSRMPEARRAEYLRNKDARRKAYDQAKDGLQYARRVIAQQTGLLVADVPIALAEAKIIQLRVARTVKEGQESKLYPIIREQYLRGRTTYQIAAEFGFERARVAAILKQAGIVLKRRPLCRHGHEMTAENAAFTEAGYRRCRKCAAESTRRNYRKRREATHHPVTGGEA